MFAFMMGSEIATKDCCATLYSKKLLCALTAKLLLLSSWVHSYFFKQTGFPFCCNLSASSCIRSNTSSHLFGYSVDLMLSLNLLWNLLTQKRLSLYTGIKLFPTAPYDQAMKNINSNIAWYVHFLQVCKRCVEIWGCRFRGWSVE